MSPTPAVAQALYVGLVTDTGRFMYENTGPRAHLMAAELIEEGVDVQAIYRRLYEEMPYPKLALLALGLGQVQRFDGDELTVAVLSAEDFRQAEAEVPGHVVDRLLEEGALDVFGMPVQMKKNRPGMLLTVLCRNEDASSLTDLFSLKPRLSGYGTRGKTSHARSRTGDGCNSLGKCTAESREHEWRDNKLRSGI